MLKILGLFGVMLRMKLIVQKKFDLKVADPPSFLVTLENVTIRAIETKQVDCIAFGPPEPDVYWIFDGERIMDGDSIKLTSSMSQGTYTCVAESDEGKAESSFYFKVPVEPNFLTDFDE